MSNQDPIDSSSSDHLPDEVEREITGLLLRPKQEQAERIAELCGAHPTLARAIRALAKVLSVESFAAQPDAIAGYEIVKVLGEGGMGTVYLARQSKPLDRQVALKVIKLGMDTRSVLTRFEHERQVLAGMDHDAIARVFDAGTTERGQPFFVMEYVAGSPLTEYCAAQRLTVDERLQLLLRICAGVRHAHQRGVIHRDLKPNNVVVSNVDGEHVPKIIDFGLARATERDENRSLQTVEGQFLGTPDYMSPEQARGSAIDTRTDVYAIGVILYELLSGERPLTATSLDGAGIVEIQRAILEHEPRTPSTRVSTSGGEETFLHSASCRTTPAALKRRLRGELDWIVMRAIEKDPERRYASVGELAADLQRYRSHEPVVARPASFAYRARKFARKYRVQVIAAMLVLLALVGGIIGTSVGMRDAEAARDVAEKSLANFDSLALIVKLDELKRSKRGLPPGWPEHVEDLRAWCDDAAGLVGALPAIRSTIESIRSRATERSADESVADDPRLGSVSSERDRLLELVRKAERVMAVSRGVAEPDVPVLDQATRDLSTDELWRRAWRVVKPVNPGDGDERESLALARLAYEKAADDRERRLALRALVAALSANGAHDEALARCEELMSLRSGDWEESAEGDGAVVWARHLADRRHTIAHSGGAADRVVRCTELDVQLGLWQVEDGRDQFLHDTLVTLSARIEAFAARELTEVGRRITWSERIVEASTGRHASRWEEARDAIRRADGVTAHEAYGNVPIDLQPHLGLVPIGMNPVTRLWEFYHLASARPPEPGHDPRDLPMPVHRADGTVDSRTTPGIVFVLVPGGEFDMGSSSAIDTSLTAIEEKIAAAAELTERPRRRVALDPFFLSRHEVTQGQWFQLTNGETPSHYRIGNIYLGNPGLDGVQREFISEVADYRLPVEGMSWSDCFDVMHSHGLDLPTEAQWEYACRAGTTTLWHAGDSPADMAGYCNTKDKTAERFYPRWGVSRVDFEDGYSGPAPVGSFAPNAWGMHDMHGNYWEWCRDVRAAYTVDPRPGDGLREPQDPSRQVVRRGGSSGDDLRLSRCASRAFAERDQPSRTTLRAARRLRK